jgi:hypothetical protein
MPLFAITGFTGRVVAEAFTRTLGRHVTAQILPPSEQVLEISQ